MYYTYGYEDYSGNKGKITVEAKTKDDSWEKIHDYSVSKGELHYAWFLYASSNETEKFYQKENNVLGLLIGLAGSALGCTQMKAYGIEKSFSDVLKDNETIAMIRR